MTREIKIKCPDYLGDGVETCHNPDHGFLSAVGGILGANESACPCCGHNPYHKMKGKCDTCGGSGNVSKDEYDSYLEEFVQDDYKDEIDEYCLTN